MAAVAQESVQAPHEIILSEEHWTGPVLELPHVALRHRFVDAYSTLHAIALTEGISEFCSRLAEGCSAQDVPEGGTLPIPEDGSLLQVIRDHKARSGGLNPFMGHRVVDPELFDETATQMMAQTAYRGRGVALESEENGLPIVASRTMAYYWASPTRRQLSGTLSHQARPGGFKLGMNEVLRPLEVGSIYAVGHQTTSRVVAATLFTPNGRREPKRILNGQRLPDVNGWLRAIPSAA